MPGVLQRTVVVHEPNVRALPGRELRSGHVLVEGVVLEGDRLADGTTVATVPFGRVIVEAGDRASVLASVDGAYLQLIRAAVAA